MKIASELILKPGAVLVAEKIDFDNPEVARFIQRSKKMQRQGLSSFDPKCLNKRMKVWN